MTEIIDVMNEEPINAGLDLSTAQVCCLENGGSAGASRGAVVYAY